MKNKHRDEILNLQKVLFTMLGVAFESNLMFTAQTWCISEQTEYLSGRSNWVTIQHSEHYCEVDKAQATDVLR